MNQAALSTFSTIDLQFEKSWERLAKEPYTQQHTYDGDILQIDRLKRCLKWCTAYSILQNHCTKIIEPMHTQPSSIIKWFWVEYEAQFLDQDIPPTPKEFFEWYCNSQTIARERKMGIA